MAELVPIRGIRYNNELANTLASLITPPYDVISEAEQENYYQKSPYNIIRLEYGKATPEDTEQNNRYTRAAESMHAWLEKAVLKQDKEEIFYLHEQEYRHNGQNLTRTGLIAGIKLTPYSKKTILPHEKTLSKPKADRLNLLRHCHANFSPIFGLYNDQNKELSQLWTPVKNTAPEISFIDEENQVHRLWLITSKTLQKKICNFFKPACIFIADGHHRYETALQFADEMSAEGKTGFDHILITLVNLYDPGLVILPTHRLVNNLPSFDPAKIIHLISEDFIVEECFDNRAFTFNHFLQKLKQAGENNTTFGLYTPGRYYLLHLKYSSGSAVQKLDVSVFQRLILKKALGITEHQQCEKNYLAYTQNAGKAVEDVISNKIQAAFFLNATKVTQVINVAQSGGKMPQKSTYFYPKLCTGIIINKLGG